MTVGVGCRELTPTGTRTVVGSGATGRRARTNHVKPELAWAGIAGRLPRPELLAIHRLRVLDTTYFFARSMSSANGISRSPIQSGHLPVAGLRHADSII